MVIIEARVRCSREQITAVAITIAILSGLLAMELLPA
jgi:hypothetical protein